MSWALLPFPVIFFSQQSPHSHIIFVSGISALSNFLRLAYFCLHLKCYLHSPVANQVPCSNSCSINSHSNNWRLKFIPYHVIPQRNLFFSVYFYTVCYENLAQILRKYTSRIVTC